MKPNQFELSSSNLNLYPHSLVSQNGVEYGLVQKDGKHLLAILSPPDSTKLSAFEGQTSQLSGKTLILASLSSQNAAALRSRLAWLNPCPLGLSTSIGMGDRLGLATPGHVRAVSSAQGQIAPIFAQQSMRENMRTGRTPQQVMDDATWGIFQEGWQNRVGADADHLKTFQDIDICLNAGFTFFTIDPGSFVENKTETASLSELNELADQLPLDHQPDTSGLLNKVFDLEGLTVQIDEVTLKKAAVKYGNAVANVVSMYHHLSKSTGDRPFELEVSVDETEQPTSHAEHIYIASELKRLGVRWISLAPRYIGTFEKGVDYIGDLAAFENDIAGHAAIARHFGPYKLSLHSGSDKFSIYPAVMNHTRGLVHLKTAGTSYLEALRTIATLDVEFCSEIYNFSRHHYENDKASYHVSAQLSRAPLPKNVNDWPGLLEQFDAREIFHVTFGSVLTQKTSSGGWEFYDRFMDILRKNPEVYAANLEKHFNRHLQPFLPEE
ncbi:MAG: hypothetical protein KAH97_07710 [Anaerolineales bacterium]|jgi:hypothetical protein|nr:hypothetical protein [Anaerolineales bacterium]